MAWVVGAVATLSACAAPETKDEPLGSSQEELRKTTRPRYGHLPGYGGAGGYGGYGGYGGPPIEECRPGQTPESCFPEAKPCGCDPASPPIELEPFLDCFQGELASWGVNVTVSGGAVVAADGTTYPRHAFESAFASDVHLELKDVERAEILVRAYEQHLRPVLTDAALRASVEWWILRYHRFFVPGSGSVDELPVDYPNKLSLYGNLAPLQRGGEHEAAFAAFIEQVAHEYLAAARFPAPRPGDAPSVSIVTGPYGGGHVSVANTIAASLADTYRVDTIDECREFSGALDIVTGGLYRGCLLYNDVEIRDGDPAKASLLEHLNWLLSFYIVPDQRGELRRTLLANGTDLVVSSVHHLPDVTGTGTAIGRPTLVAITDFSFPAGQYFDLNHVSAEYVQYLIPTVRREFFRPMMLDYYAKSWEARVPSSRTAYLHDRLFAAGGAEALDATMLADLGVFEPIGFPVNAAMHPPASAADILAARSQLALGTNLARKVIAIAFGSTPDTAQVRAVLERLIAESARFAAPIELALVSAGNTAVADLARALFEASGIPVDASEGETEASPLPDKVTARIFPRLTQEAIAELYRATDAYVSKAGGATTAEVIASSTPFVRGFGLWPWEYENALWLAELGLSLEPVPEVSDPLALDTSFLGVDPSAEALVGLINATITQPRILGPVPGALQFEPAALKAIVARTIGAPEPSIGLPSERYVAVKPEVRAAVRSLLGARPLPVAN